MKYKNTKTGAVVYSDSPVNGGSWVEVKEDTPKKNSKTAKKKGSD